MIITIDTEKDSPEQLRKAASFLQSLADEKPVASAPAAPQAQPAAFDMFDMSSDNPRDVATKQEPADDDDDGFRMIPY